MTKRKEILDSLWLVRGAHLDAEYFSYVLLAAAQKYRKDLEEVQESEYLRRIHPNMSKWCWHV